MEEISLTINGTRVSCAAGASVLEAAEQNGIRIPTLCYHPELKPFGACRLCLVEDEKSGRILASCVTPVTSDMAIQTDSPRVLNHRKNIVRLMMAEHPESCLVCSKGNRCELREIAAEMGLGAIGLHPIPNYKGIEQANPFIIRDLSKCILCGKCIRADHERVVAGAIDYHHRGFVSRPATLHDLPLEASSCTFCGTCISICPTGALTPTITGHVGTPEQETTTACGFCGVGCSLCLGTAGNRVVEVNPSGLPGSVNGITLCVRGHFAHDFLNSPDRLIRPMIRQADAFVPATWEDALNRVAAGLLDIKKREGPQSIGFLGSSKCTNEENYLFQKIARVHIGTHNLDNGGALAGRPALQIIDEKTGGACRVNRLDDLEKAGAIVVMGADPGNSAPVLGYTLRRAARKGIPIIGINPRQTDLFPFARSWLRVSPGKDDELVTCLTALLWKKFAHDASFIERYTEGFEAYIEWLSSFNPERLCLSSGVDMALLSRAADLLKGEKIRFVVGHGITQQRHGRETMAAILNLAVMTGSLGPTRGGLYVISRENNLFGAWDMGTVPDALPGRTHLEDGSGRQEWERTWGVKISPDRGLDALRMIHEAEKGNLRAMVIMGENPLRSFPQRERIAEALSRLDLLVVLDILHSETSRMATVVLPGAAFSEKAGSFTSMEGRINCFTPAAPPPGDAKSDWEILDRLAVIMGQPKRYGSMERIRDEIARCLPTYAGLTEVTGTGWTWIREASRKRPFHFSIPAAARAEDADDSYPFTATLVSQRFHLGSGTRTEHSRRTSRFGLKGEVDVSPQDAARLKLENGDRVRVASRAGVLTREVRIDSSVQPGQVFVPMAFHNNDAMNLIQLTAQASESWEGMNTCGVTVEKLDMKHQSSLLEAQG